ncbi:hypothetical protein [Streptantibioticus silvisoli]|uniref:Uncharacterized protein n=1 Tax=Streptantibioticus silvisoli TaxID=2705255 RepID=A0ABT6W6V6_9ACTN|nr:hypothetical protein [Streptantibioticus silvisoli]MDI5965702.1 hypothetical protein [Streptantibioticus silvisoli]
MLDPTLEIALAQRGIDFPREAALALANLEALLRRAPDDIATVDAFFRRLADEGVIAPRQWEEVPFEEHLKGLDSCTNGTVETATNLGLWLAQLKRQLGPAAW